jgi:hypothetical protein
MQATDKWHLFWFIRGLDSKWRNFCSTLCYNREPYTPFTSRTLWHKNPPCQLGAQVSSTLGAYKTPNWSQLTGIFKGLESFWKGIEQAVHCKYCNLDSEWISPAIPSMCPTLYAEECYLFVEMQRTLGLSDLKSLSIVMHKQVWYGLFSRLRNYQSNKTSTSVLMGQGSVPLERSVVDGICQALQSF